MIESYVQRFDVCLIGSPAEKREWHAELVGHLEEARENNDLEAALGRLGSPREAAAAFRAARPLDAASLVRRWVAQAIDHIPLLVVTAAIAIHQIMEGGHSFGLGFPFGLAISSDDPLWVNLARALSVLWSWAGLAVVESAARGRTPGKALLTLRTVSDDGTTVSLGQALARRWSILLGMLAWLDWGGALFTRRRQRLLDLLAHTLVVSDPERVPANERSLSMP